MFCAHDAHVMCKHAAFARTAKVNVGQVAFDTDTWPVPVFSQEIGLSGTAMASACVLVGAWAEAEWAALWSAMGDSGPMEARGLRPMKVTWLHVRDVCEFAPNMRMALHRGMFYLLADSVAAAPAQTPGGQGPLAPAFSCARPPGHTWAGEDLPPLGPCI